MQKEGVDVEPIPTSILEFIPKADIMQNEELYGLRLLGLEAVFDVKKKPRFCWEALGVFILGVAQIAAGACIAVLSAGALSSFATGLIMEGVSDCYDGAVGMIKNEFDLKEWAISKACSIAISAATGGVGKFISKGAKAAVKSFKAAQGMRSGIQAATKSAGKAAGKGASIVSRDVKVMSKALKGNWGKSLKAGIKTVGKYTAKQVVEKGVMYGLNEIERLAIEKIFAEISTKFSQSVEVVVRCSFLSCNKQNLGYFVNLQINSTQLSSVMTLEVKKFFASISDEAVHSLLYGEKDESVFEEFSERFRGLLPQLSQSTKGTTKALVKLCEIKFIADSIAKTTEQLKSLTAKFEHTMVSMCEKTLRSTGELQAVEDTEVIIELKLRKQQQNLVKQFPQYSIKI